MAVTLKGKGSQATWGIETATDDTFATAEVQSMERNRSAEQEPLLDKQGETTGVAIYDEKDELTIEVVVTTGTIEPEIGGDLKIDGVQGIVTGVDVKWENKSWKKLAVTGTKFHAMSDTLSGGG